MRLPPPARITLPLVVLVFGVIVTMLEYRLNLDLDLTRHLSETQALADATAERTAQLSQSLLAQNERTILREYLSALENLPLLTAVAVVDADGVIVESADDTLRGRRASATPLAEAAALLNRDGQPSTKVSDDAHSIFAARPFAFGDGRQGWSLIVFNRVAAMASAKGDAQRQLGWMISAMTFLCFMLWVALHFGFADRLARLAQSIRDYGAGTEVRDFEIAGADEVHALSVLFGEMVATLDARDAERARLQREVLEISEREQRRIGHDLHDGIGQRLTAASMATNAAVAALQAEAPAHAERVASIGRLLRETIADVRVLSRGLAPVELQGEGLMEALAALAQTTSHNTGVRCVFECRTPVHVPDLAVATNLYRIAQEAVNNALKHASAHEILIALEQRASAVVLEVEDDGEGMEEDSARGSGLGLCVMRYRAQISGGTLDILPAPAGGTRICCRIQSPS